MTDAQTAPAGPRTAPRRELYKEQTRRDLALAAFTLAKANGLAGVRVPQIAAAAGVSARTFNNYFTSKEAAIAWLAGRHVAGMAAALRERPAGEPLAEALTAAVLAQYQPAAAGGRPRHFLRDFRELAASEPALQREYLASMAAFEQELGEVIAGRAPSLGPLRSQVLAAMVFGAERAAVRHWMKARSGSLADTVRDAVGQAVAGLGGVS